MIEPDPFITPQDLSDYLGRDLTSDNGALMACDAACSMIRGLVEQSLNAGTATIFLDGAGTDALVLPEWPVGTITAVVADGGTITDYCATTNGVLIRGSAGVGPRALWTMGRQNVQVTYTYGWQVFPTNQIPRDVRMVALTVASRMVVQGVAQSETIGDVTVDYGMAATDFTDGERAILYGYIRHRSF
jgi:hypothetical protein